MKVGYSKTFPIYGKEEWEKNWLECDISMPGDLINLSDEDIAKYMLNVRRVQYALKKQVEGFHYESNKAEEKKATKTEISISVKDDKEWEAIKKQLSTIQFQEDAQEYLNTTAFSMVVEAKKIIAGKPIKNLNK